jgi:quercetin dioxygenase-like cupin family protein
MKRLVFLLVVLGAAVSASVALATLGQGQSPTVLSSGAMNGDVAFDTGLDVAPKGITWQDKQYSADQLPEFLMRLRSAGVANLGEWLNLHPGVSARFGMLPISVLHAPEIVTQTVKFAPGASSGWHSHPGFLVSTVVSGQLVRYGTDCSAQTFGPGQSFYETGANTFVVKNESDSDAVDTVTFVVPGGTPSTGLRIDKPQPTTCTK